MDIIVKELKNFLDAFNRRWETIDEPGELLRHYFSYPNWELWLKLPDKTIVKLSDWIDLDGDIKDIVETLKVLANNIIRHEEEKKFW